jgi:hypothetical protein
VIPLHTWVKQGHCCSNLSEWRPIHLPVASCDGRLTASSSARPRAGQRHRGCALFSKFFCVVACGVCCMPSFSTRAGDMGHGDSLVL